MTTETTLWLPNTNASLDHEYPALTATQLHESWQRYSGQLHQDLQNTPDVLGTMRKPSRMPANILSIDLCEVVRTTHASLRTIEEPAGTPIEDIHAYGKGIRCMQNYGDIQAVAQVMISAGLIAPVENIAEIARITRTARKNNTYVIANTSTLPGCEQGTVDFLAQYMRGCFDGIVFPRNFDGKGEMNKGKAGEIVLRECARLTDTTFSETTPLNAVHIDDLPHHHGAFHRVMGAIEGVRVTTVQPLYPSSNSPHAQSILTQTPLQAFEAAQTILQQTA